MQPRGQTKLGSLVEAAANVVSSFAISVLLWQYVVGPLYGITTEVHQSSGIVGIFMAVGMIRSYLWRRLFNKRIK